MKIIPFVREPASPPPKSGTFPRTRTRETEDLASRFNDLTTDSLSPPLSASSTHFSSTPATSPETSMGELPSRKSGSHPRPSSRLRGTPSRESVRSLFAPPQLASPHELEWEKTLEDAAARASWQSSIEHRPRPHRVSSSNSVPTRVSQSTWPRVSAPTPVANSLQLEHVFVDAGSVRGPFAVRSQTHPSRSFGDTSNRLVGRIKPARDIPDASSVWQMGRRRSSGFVPTTAFAGGSTRKMPTIPQGHSRETSAAEMAEEDFPWSGVDPYTQSPGDAFPRGFSRKDSFVSDGPGEYLPFSFGRRESRDDIALLTRRRSSSNSSQEGPIFRPTFRPTFGRSTSSGELRHRPDVPEAVTGSEAEDGEVDDEGWCRRRSTFASVGVPHEVTAS
ncbi:hypothetical protein PSEUBRA_001470 [Kalmanozyma brasiliensis GHG001]|uniref:uncharacterized protein n=1 Tax=Kalmanozyma brasiliensis (strain GHG001) TaxID=1365824 RepID=UPI002868318E|nr:uncharacterized protein PSEUBRA_001470 [Kalmanozyma brasiliensis GHG001]KAF6766944.1 hypothetical protein PSEUBRA_001470 [Kalmanozyma brasiliensis GHG001]